MFLGGIRRPRRGRPADSSVVPTMLPGAAPRLDLDAAAGFLLEGMRIGEIAALVGLTTRAIRHYHHVGLLPEPARRPNGYRG